MMSRIARLHMCGKKTAIRSCGEDFIRSCNNRLPFPLVMKELLPVTYVRVNNDSELSNSCIDERTSVYRASQSHPNDGSIGSRVLYVQ